MNFDLTYQFMIPMVELFYKWTHSYGWAIVLVTLAVRALLWGLVANQTKSMMRMSQVQPHMKAIQERYAKSDPEKFQKKTMEFYQKNKVKRRIREAYRLLRLSDLQARQDLAQWYAMVFVIQPKAIEADWSQLRGSVSEAISKAAAKYGTKKGQAGPKHIEQTKDEGREKK